MFEKAACFIVIVFLFIVCIISSGCIYKDYRSGRGKIKKDNIMQENIFDKVRSGVCAIGYFEGEIKDYKFVVLGTGFIVRDNTVITNRHVLEDLRKYQDKLNLSKEQLYLEFVYPVDKNKWREGFCRIKFASFLEELDIGFIDFNPRPEFKLDKQCLPLKLGDLSTIIVGQSVGVIGYPYGDILLDIKVHHEDKISDKFRRWGPIFHHGYISAITPVDNIGSIDRLLLDISNAGGMSGSPVFKLEDGSVIGLFYAGAGSTVGFAIPIDSEKVNKWLESYDKLKMEIKE